LRQARSHPLPAPQDAHHAQIRIQGHDVGALAHSKSTAIG
jgi:hypothetical protein